MLNKRKNNWILRFSDDCKGISYVEVLVTISLLSVVLLSMYLFMSFSFKSMIYTQAKYDITQDARVSLIKLGSNIRKAQATRIAGVSYKAVAVNASGMQINIYVDVDNDGDCEIVQYKLDGNNLVMGVAELGHSPSLWYTMIDKVENHRLASPEPIFTIDNNKVIVMLYIKDEFENLSDPVCIKTIYTVRSKGAM